MNIISSKVRVPLIGRYFLVFFLLAMVILAVYGQVVQHEFISLDDHKYVTGNAHVLKGFDLSEVQWVFTHFYDGNWIPLTWISLMLDVQLFGVNPGVHHLVNVLIHLLNSFMLFLFLKRATGKGWNSVFVAFVFAVHPIHVESVAWISERKDVLSAFFGFLFFLTYVYYVKNSKKRWYVLSLIFLVLGFLAKAMVMTLPFLLLLFDYWPLKRLRERTHFAGLLIEKVPFFAVTGILSTVAFLAQHAEGYVRSFASLPLDFRLANVALSYMKYLAKMTWPFDLALSYPFVEGNILIMEGILSLLILSFITIYCIRNFKSYPAIFVGWVWYGISLMPVSGIVPLGSYSMADRYAYIPLIGIYIICGFGIPEILKTNRFRNTILRIAGVVWVLFLALLCGWQVGFWTNSGTLFTRSLQVTKKNYVAHENLAKYYTEKEFYKKALYHYQQAAAIQPHPDVLINLGNSFYQLGNLDKAREIYEIVVQKDSSRYIAWCNLGNVYLSERSYGRAGSYFAEALKRKSDFLPAIIGLAECLIEIDRQTEARYLLKRGLSLYPDNLVMQNLLQRIPASK